MRIKKLSRLNWLMLALLVSGVLVAGFYLRSGRASTQDLKLGLSAWRIRVSKSFVYDKNGHVGAQTQYLTKQPDSRGANFCIQCKGGKVSAIIVTYSQPVDRRTALEQVEHLLAGARLKNKDSVEMISDPQHEIEFRKGNGASEYFYFEGGKAAELQFLSPLDQRVSRFTVWG